MCVCANGGHLLWIIITIIIIMMMMMMMMMMMIIIIIIIIIMMMMMMMMIALGRTQFEIFFTIPSLRRELSPTRTLKTLGHNSVKITCNTSSAYHVQHVVLRATWYEGTAQLLSLTDFKSHFYLSFILLAEPFTGEGGEETGVPGENPW